MDDSKIYKRNEKDGLMFRKSSLIDQECIQNISCMTVFEDGNFLCGGPAGSIMVVDFKNIMNGNGFILQCDNEMPLGDITVLDDGSLVFYFWQTKDLWHLAFGQLRANKIDYDTDLFHGFVTSLDSKGQIVAWGCSNGEIYVKEIDAVNAGPWILQARHGQGKVSVDSIVIDKDKKSMFSGGSDGSVMHWDLTMIGPSLQNRWTLSTSGPAICSMHVMKRIVNPKDFYLLTGIENGTVALWDISKKQKLAVMGWLGGDHVYSIHVVEEFRAENGTRYFPLVIIGNDSGRVRVYCNQQLESSVDKRTAFEMSEWTLLEEMDFSSPISGIHVVQNIVYVGTCENGIQRIHLDELSCFAPTAKRFVSENTSQYFVEHTTSPSKGVPTMDRTFEKDDVSVTSEEPMEEDVYDPVPMAKPMPMPEPERDTICANTEDQDFPIPDIAPEPMELPSYDNNEIVDQQTCYDGWLDQDVPPLPLSVYHEPTLNATSRLDEKLKKITEETFDPRNAVTKEAIRKEFGASVATKLLHVGSRKKIYGELMPIRSKADTHVTGFPVYKTRRTAPQVSDGWQRKKTIMERQNEVIARHRMMREAKAEEMVEEDEPSQAASSSSVQGTSTHSHQPEQDRKSTETSSETRRATTFETSWARPEFYLTTSSEGKVGFHNFRSLRKTSTQRS